MVTMQAAARSPTPISEHQSVDEELGLQTSIVPLDCRRRREESSSSAVSMEVWLWVGSIHRTEWQQAEEDGSEASGPISS